ncbi:hypothetical protein [Microbacterium sp.]|jgi:hypothetical protein|uniref:hypothetical protein n=1 Tax=Microbacterium sp. TaxID=51671 RepID=UPI0025FCF51C|nr:hypothetical protein [Microbacterium sp.]
MRTTVTIDDDVLAAAKQFADSRGLTLGEALSQLARATLTERRRFDTRNGIVLLPASSTATPASLEDVNALRDDPS